MLRFFLEKCKKILTFSSFVLKYQRKCKDHSRKEAFFHAKSERGAVKALAVGICRPLLLSPGRTGTGAPVTEQLRCPGFVRMN